MGIEWTPAQQDAIELHGPDILVSAGAGAGKTSVLVERVIQQICDPERQLGVDQLLVVTFSEEAASQMRRRIRQRLEEALSGAPDNRWLRRQLGLLGRAQISTLHAFCLQLVRRYFHQLDLDPGARVLGEHEARLLEQEVLDERFERAYAAGRPAFLQLVECYGSRDDENLQERCLALHRLAFNQPWPAEWLARQQARFRQADQQPLEATEWFPVVSGRVQRELGQALYDLAQAEKVAALPGGPAAWLDVLEEDHRRVQDLCSDLEGADWDTTAALLAEADGAWPRLTSARGVAPEAKEPASKLRNRAKRQLKNLSQGLANRSSEELAAELRRWAPLGDALVDLVLGFDADFSAAKRQRGLLDFNDMERLAFQLLQDAGTPAGELQPSNIAAQLRRTYAEVLVDEYQDINELQDAIIHLVAQGDGRPGGLFLVGDVKQSIYRFRGAEPELFVRKYNAYTPLEDGEHEADPGDLSSRAGAYRIDLNHNFRSRRPILKGVNFLFRQLMRPQLGGVNYDDAAALTAGLTFPDPDAGLAGASGPAPVEVHLLERELEDEAETTSLEREAVLMGRRILALVNGEEDQPPLAVWDREHGVYRRVRYRDVVILLRAARRQADVIRDILHRMDVPVYARAATGFFQALEVEVMMALLQVIDNPQQEIPLATVLRSPVCGLTPGDLAAIRLAAPDDHFFSASQTAAGGGGPQPLETAARRRLARFLEQLDRWRTQARRGPLSQLITAIYEETGLTAYVTGMPGGEQRRANLMGLLERARQFDRFHRQGLFRFLRFIQRLRERDEDLATPPALSEGQDVVRIMTIHQSKGLEFPVVFVANLGGGFNRDQHQLLLDRRLGLGPQLVDLDQRIRYPTFAHHAVREEQRLQQLAEELRLLYVAMTRAQERLILVGSKKDLAGDAGTWAQAADRDDWLLPDPLVLAADSYLDWLGPALIRHGGGEGLRELAAAGDRRENDPSLLEDESRWSVRLWLAAEAAGLSVMDRRGGQQSFWQQVAAGTPLSGREPGAAAQRLGKRLDWQYPRKAVTQRFAKLSATEVKEVLDPQRRQHPTPARLRRSLKPPPNISSPGPAQETGEGQTGLQLSGAERGASVHRVLQLLDLGRSLDRNGIEEQAAGMVHSGQLSAEQAAAVDPGQLAAFFASPLGERVKCGQTRRELMFTMSVPAPDVYPDLPDEAEGAAAEEQVVVQGMIDCLVMEPDGYLLIDFKTDRLAADVDLDAYARRYATQVALYRRAVEASTGQPVREAYLYFLNRSAAVAQ